MLTEVEPFCALNTRFEYQLLPLSPVNIPIALIEGSQVANHRGSQQGVSFTRFNLSLGQVATDQPFLLLTADRIQEAGRLRFHGVALIDFALEVLELFFLYGVLFLELPTPFSKDIDLRPLHFYRLFQFLDSYVA